ncbi:MAG: DUF1361 domain-containing protein [Candidatus Gracilibacteria bacterium]
MRTLKHPLVFLILLDLIMVAGRVLYTSEITYAFLVWNLLLALFPFLLSSWAQQKQWPQGKRLWLLALGFLWLFFLPNAPYILSDFYHLRTKTDMATIWIDILMIFSYSLTGLMMFYWSLLQAFELWKKVIKRGAEPFIIAVLLLCSIAIYPGRYLRLNSWDLFTQPDEVLSAFLTALSSSSFWRITLPYFLFLTLGYVFVRLLKSSKSSTLR